MWSCSRRQRWRRALRIATGNTVRSRAAGEDGGCVSREGVPLIRPNGIRISSAPISGGYAVWQDNVRPLTEPRARLSENKTKINSNKEKPREAYIIQKKLLELTEKPYLRRDGGKVRKSDHQSRAAAAAMPGAATRGNTKRTEKDPAAGHLH